MIEDNKIIYISKDNNMRILKYYNTFFAHYSYKLQRLSKFLWWTYWETIEDDSLGRHSEDWANHFGLDSVKKEQS